MSKQWSIAKCQCGDAICDKYFLEGPTGSEGRMSKEDATLAAAAPRLLGVLEKALRDSGCDGDLCNRQWHDDARQSIAAAKGETP